MELYNHHTYTNYTNDNQYPLYKIKGDVLSIINMSPSGYCNLHCIKFTNTKYFNMGPDANIVDIDKCILLKNELITKMKSCELTDDEYKTISNALLAEIPHEIYFNYKKMLEKFIELKIVNVNIVRTTHCGTYNVGSVQGPGAIIICWAEK